MTHFIQTYGPAFIFLIVALESGGLPLPGETTLIAASVLASRGRLDIVEVIVLAAAGAIIGDNAGYWVGRTGGRKLLYHWEWLGRIADRVLPPAERFFHRHGPKTVFLARFVAGLRVTAAWMAGISRMSWWRFLLWNALGGVVWATAVGLIAFYVGRTAADALRRWGLLGAAVVVVVSLLAIGGFHLWRRRVFRAESEKG